MGFDTALIEKTSRQVMAILGEARCYPRTGRTLPDVGKVPPGAALASLIDHTLLKPEATARQIESLCFEAKEFGFAAVCVNSSYVPLAAELLRGSLVKICAVVGFPLGASLPQVKVYEADEAIRSGAREIDMVIPVGMLKNRDLVGLHEDISDVAVCCHDNDVLVKVAIETALLTEEEKIIAALIARVVGADFVKTSTGFNGGGATTDDVALIRYVVGDGVGVKASGGIADFATAQALVQAGANRIGSSAGVLIARQERGETVSAAR